jgi:CBS domain-containing protein
MPRAKDVMVTELIVLSPETSVHEAMSLLMRNDISGAPVLDAHGNVVGILTEKDCLRAIFRASYHQDPGGTVADTMSREVRTIDAETDLSEVIEIFLRGPYRRFPVLAGTRLVGQISRHDILRAVVGMW